MKLQFRFLMAIASFSLLTAHADELTEIKSIASQFDFHGFATQSYLYSSDNNFFGESSEGSFEFHELGLNTLWHPTNNFKIAAQIVARDAGNTDDGSIRLDYGFFEYQFRNTEQSTTGIRLGRVVNPLGLYNESRDVAATRPGTLLPQSIYFDVNRNLALSSDGLKIYHETYNENGDLSFEFGVAEPRTRDPDLEVATFGSSRPGNFDGATSWLARVLYDYDLGKIRIGLTAAEINLEYDGRNDPFLADGDLSLTPIILSAQYQSEKWGLTAEYAKRTTQLSDFGLIPNLDIEGTSYFLQAAYRITSKITAQIRYDSLVWNDDDKDGEIMASSPFYAYPGHTRYAYDWTVGIRWDINQNWLINAEFHDVEGTGWLSLLENPDPAKLEKNWQLFAFTVSVRF